MAAEKNFENRVKEYLRSCGVWTVKYWGGGRFTKAGVPDLLCCCDGVFMGIEIKSTVGRPSKLQIHNLKQIDEAGGAAVLLYPEDFELFKTMVETIQAYGFTDAEECYNKLKGRWLN